ncbi:TadE family protein [Methylobacterium sp.]|uniref:TadE/TadG family type IV pilus assembly protein n=1 Tax=Methylobacterium sp. TaxID=409 RepID=UPI002590FB9B|nr:TadE family protein [Methylobacterium sp.]
MALPVLVMLTFGTVEYGTLLHRRATLQTAVDEGVLAAGNMLKLANTTEAVVVAAATHVIAQRAATPPDRRATISVRVLDQRTSVERRSRRRSPP